MIFQRSFARRIGALPLVAGALLAGCATTRIDDLAMTPGTATTPSGLVVDVGVVGDLARDPLAQRAAGELEARLLHAYGKAGIDVAAAGERGVAPDAARLRVRVSRVARGNAIKRFAIGFGAGNAALATTAVLEVPGIRGPALRFSSRSDGGLRPGFVLPAGIAAATGKASNLAISAGLGLFGVSRTGLASDADRSAKRIVAETRRHYRRVGWTWPDA